jgi:DNA-binding CsgD family transcriptional regulator
MATAEAPPIAAPDASTSNGSSSSPFSPDTLSPKQRIVYDYVKAGKSTAEIAEAMDITPNGVANHISRLKRSGHLEKSQRAARGPRKAGAVRAASDHTKASALHGVTAALNAARKKLADVKSLEQEIKSLEAAHKALGGVSE